MPRSVVARNDTSRQSQVDRARDLTGETERGRHASTEQTNDQQAPLYRERSGWHRAALP
jgi:hypothetical protein